VQAQGGTDKVETEIAEIEERLVAGVQAATVLPIFAATDPSAAFLAAPVDGQREVLRVEVLPPPRKGASPGLRPGFD
jgi:hypothetical protein